MVLMVIGSIANTPVVKMLATQTLRLNTKNMNNIDGNLVSSEVDINFNRLHTLMFN